MRNSANQKSNQLPTRQNNPGCYLQERIVYIQFINVRRDDAEFIPPRTIDLPVAKYSGDVPVRVAKDCDGPTARYTSPMMTLISTSTHVWHGVLASRGEDGTFMRPRERHGHPSGRDGGWQDCSPAVGRARVWSISCESSNMGQLSGMLEDGPPLQQLGEYMFLWPWRDAHAPAQEVVTSGAQVELLSPSSLAVGLGLPQPGGWRVRVECILAVATAAVGLPESGKCAMLLSFCRYNTHYG